MDKPPLGVLPKFLWDEQRMVDLTEAINRFMDANEPVPSEWVQELAEITMTVVNNTAKRFGQTPEQVMAGIPEMTLAELRKRISGQEYDGGH